MTAPVPMPIGPVDWEAVETARTMTGEERFLMCLDLFDIAYSVCLAGVRHQFPDVDEVEARRILDKRLSRDRALQVKH